MSLRVQRLLVLIAALLCVVVTVSLGNWQLRRADQKQAMADLAATRHQDAPLRNADWPCAGAADVASPPEQRPVRLSGRWMPQKLVYLDNRPMDGQAGFFVVTPLQLDPAPVCGPAWVMVQRGWVPRHQANRQQLPPVDTPHDLVVVTGHVIKDISQAYALGAEPRVAAHVASPLLRQNMGREAWAEWVGATPAPGAVLQADSGASNSPASTSNQLKRAWPAPDSGVGKHHAYAAQWFALALIITGLYVWFQLLRPRRAS